MAMAKRGGVKPTRKLPKRPKLRRQIVWPFKGDRSGEKPVRPGEKPQYNPRYGRQGKPQKKQPIPAQPKRGWTAQQPVQPVQPIQQPQQPAQPQQIQQPRQTVGGLWRAMILIILIILVIIFLINLFSTIGKDLGPGGPSGGNCLTTCEGYAVVQAPGCDCPPNSYLSPTTPYAYLPPGCEKGCKQCICR